MKLHEFYERAENFFGKEKKKEEPKKDKDSDSKPEPKSDIADSKDSDSKDTGPTKRVVISYATHEFPIKKKLETQIKNKAKELGAKDVDHSMSKDNVRSLHFDVPKAKAGEFEAAAKKMIKSFDFSVK